MANNYGCQFFVAHLNHLLDTLHHRSLLQASIVVGTYVYLQVSPVNSLTSSTLLYFFVLLFAI